MERKSDHNLSSMNFTNSSQYSAAGSLSKISTPTSFPYKRSRQQAYSDTLFPHRASEKAHPNTNFLPVISCGAPSLVSNEHVVSLEKEHVVSIEKADTEAARIPLLIPVKCAREALPSKSLSSGCSLGEEFGYVEDSKRDMDKNIDACLVNDSSSSLKSNMDSTTLKIVVDDNSECSSSEALIKESSSVDLSEKGVHILILRSLGLYKGVWPIRPSASLEVPGSNSECNCLQACKVCDQSESTLKMLICDQCEEAFHVYCCQPRLRKLPINEWSCHSCIRKKHKISKGLIARGPTVSSHEMGRGRTGIFNDSLCTIVSMLKDTEPYTTSVRIGLEYQAEVPGWSGTLANEVDNLDEPLEVSLSDNFREGYSTKSSNVSSICNWLQCQAIICGVDETVCGKWRRAPLFEVQSDRWECFCSILWDPAHADCAVPQEVDTVRVIKDLKYIEMLRSRLSAKKLQRGFQ